MDSPGTTSRARDWVLGTILGTVFTLFLLALTQRNLTYDGAAFLAVFTHAPRPSLPHHPLFGYLLWAWLEAGKALGIGVILSGQMLAAAFAGLSVSLFYALLRRHNIKKSTALIYSMLLGLNMTVLENATSVELYTPSLTAVLLTLHVLRPEIPDSGPAGVFFLWLASMIVVGFHVGFAPWVLAVYVSLALGARNWKGASLWLLRGATVLAGLVLWLFFEGHLTLDEFSKQRGFFDQHGRLDSLSSSLLLLAESPLTCFGQFAGLILFPAAFGCGIYRRTRPVEFRATVVAVLIFWLVYTFWAVDYGSFFTPLLPAIGLGSALAHDEALRWLERRGLALWISAMGVYAYLFMFLPQINPGGSGGQDILHVLAMLFWVAVIAPPFMARLTGFGMGNLCGDDASRMRFQLAFGTLAVVLSALCYVPRFLDLRQPDSATILLEQFAAATPPEARLVTHLPPYRPEVQSGRQTLSAVEGWNDWMHMARNRKKLTEWLRELAADPRKRVFLDDRMFQQREFVFGNEATGNRTELGLERFEFKALKTDGLVFHEVVFRDESDRKLVARGMDLFDAEDWGGVTVRWTRRAAALRFISESRYVKVKYWIGHPDVDPANAVDVKILIDGMPHSIHSHTAQDAYSVTLDLGENWTGEHELVIEISRTWLAPDGRALGVGLYPLEFSNQP